MKPRKLLSILTVMASVVMVVICLLLIFNTSSVSFTGLGNLTGGTVSLFFLQVSLLSAAVILLSLLSLTDRFQIPKIRFRKISLLMLIIGLILAVEGIAAINLNGSVSSGATSADMIFIGLEIYALGIMSIISYVVGKRKISAPGPFNSVTAIAFILMLLPAAFLLA